MSVPSFCHCGQQGLVKIRNPLVEGSEVWYCYKHYTEYVVGDPRVGVGGEVKDGFPYCDKEGL